MDVDKLRDFGAEQKLINILKGEFKQLRDIQADAVKNGLFKNTSLFICTPSGSGKTLIAEMAAINNIISKSFSKSLYLVPLRALAGEKFTYFTEMYSPYNINIVMAVGDMEVKYSELINADLLIMTYEKFDSYLRDLSENKWLMSISTIIIDEIHIIGEEKRGPRLEVLLMRTFHNLKNIQFIALSATVANYKEMANWLNDLSLLSKNTSFKMIYSEKRPVKLEYGIVTSKNKVKTISDLIKQTILEDGQILVFTNSRRDSEVTAIELSDLTLSLNKEYLDIKSIISNSDANKLLINSKVSSEIIDILRKGIGYHHAGLNFKERYLVEKLFQKGIIKVIVCTTTLSAGINTPARMVILKQYTLYNSISEIKEMKTGDNLISFDVKRKFTTELMDRNVFHQIMGRAGRPGYDEIGIAKIIVNDSEEGKMIQDYYFKKEESSKSNSIKFIPKYDNITSSLSNWANLLEFLLLSIYEIEEGINVHEISNIIDHSYYSNLKKEDQLENLISKIEEYEIFQILKMYSNKDTYLKTTNMKLITDLLKISTHEILALIIEEESNKKFKVKFNDDGIFCSCNTYYNNQDFQIDKEGEKFKFCPHEIFLLKNLLKLIDSKSFEIIEVNNQRIEKKGDNLPIFKSAAELIDEANGKNITENTIKIEVENKDIQNYTIGSISNFEAERIIKTILNRSIKNQNLIEFLVDNGLIRIVSPHENTNPEVHNIEIDDESGSFLLYANNDSSFITPPLVQCTILGEIIIKNYIYPDTALFFKNYIENLLPSYNGNIPDKILEKNFIELAIILINKEERRVPRFAQEILGWRASGINRVELIYNKLIEIYEENQIRFNFYFNDLVNFLEFSTRIFKFMMDFIEGIINYKDFTPSEFQILNTYFKIISSLYYKIKYGIKEEMVFLAKLFRNIKTEDIIKLFNAGMVNENNVITNIPKVSEILNIPVREIERILNI